MYEFRARQHGNKPLLRIEGYSIEHIFESRYFTTYTHDGKFTVFADDDKVFMTMDGGETRMVIGFIKEIYQSITDLK